MTHISEHHSEEEREGGNRNCGWVCFLVLWNTISVDDELEDFCHFVGLDEGWSGNCVVLVSDHSHGWELVRQLVNDASFLFGWSPEVSNENSVLHLHHIQSLVEGLLFGEEHLVDIDRRDVVVVLVVHIQFVEDHELVLERRLSLLKHIPSILNPLADSLDL